MYAAERWNPATGAWKTLAAEQVTRQYHSTALLLPDGRVLSAGGGICGTCDSVGYLAKNAQVFTPPYLFKTDGSGELAPRPTITAAPADVDLRRRLPDRHPGRAPIRKVALVRLGAVTHSVNMEQRYVPLAFTAGAGTLTATAPANANIAPPGVYMLFVVDANGVPSEAKMVTVGVDAPPPPAPAAPAAAAARERAADRGDHRPGDQRDVREEGEHHHDRDGRGRRRDRRPRRVPPQRFPGRHRHDVPLLVDLEQLHARHPHDHRARCRQRGRQRERDGHDHGPAEVGVQRIRSASRSA